MTEPAWGPDAGDFVWIDFSPTAGSDQCGHRPALVLSSRAFNEATGRGLFVPITTRDRGWPFQITIGTGETIAGVVMVDQARLMDWRSRKLKPAGAASELLLQSARTMLGKIAGLI